MRCNPLRWLWGIVLIFGLLGIMNLSGVLAGIQAELEGQTSAALEKAGLGWAKIEFAGRDAVVSGKAPDESEQRRAGELARSVRGVRTVENRTELIEEQKNYTWGAVLRESRLRLIGYVPNETMRKAIVGAAKATFPQLEIDDRMALARGAPETEAWLGAVAFGLKQLSGLKSGGRVDLDRSGLSIDGEAEDFAAYRSIRSALANSVPQGVKIKNEKVLPPVAKPYVWSARLAGNQLQLGGFVPSERAREEILAVVQKEFPKRVLIDRMHIAAGEPRDMPAAATALLQKLAQLEEGAVELKDGQLQVSGLAVKQETAEALRAGIRAAIPDHFKIAEQIKFREATIKPVSPYRTSVVLEGATIQISGYAPNEAAKTALGSFAQARLPGRRLTDETQLGAGAPEDWLGCMSAALTGLAKLGNGRAELENRTLRFQGVTDDEDGADTVRNEMRAAANRACDLEVSIVVNMPPEPDLKWRAVSAEGEIVLEGEVPDEATKTELALLAARLFPKSRLVDRTEVKPSYTKKWSKVSDMGLKVLSKLRNGEVRVAGLELSVVGQAPDAAVATAVRQQLRDLPKGYVGKDAIEIRSDAMIWAEQEAKRKADAEARRKLEEEERQKQEEEARRKAGQGTRGQMQVETTMAAAPPAPPPVSAPQPQSVTIPAAQPAQPEAPAASPPLAPPAPQNRPPAHHQAALARPADDEAPQCRQAVDSVGERGSIRFDRASAALPNEAYETLRKLAAVAGACPGLQIHVDAHTDAEGTPERNLMLSERRADAVIEYLRAQGVPAERLTMESHGATRPVAPNDSPTSRALNRRVEYTIRPK